MNEEEKTVKPEEEVVMPCKHDIDNAIVYMENHHADVMFLRIKCMNCGHHGYICSNVEWDKDADECGNEDCYTCNEETEWIATNRGYVEVRKE